MPLQTPFMREEETALYSRRDGRGHNPKGRHSESLRGLGTRVNRFATGIKQRKWGVAGEKSVILGHLAQLKSEWMDGQMGRCIYVCIFRTRSLESEQARFTSSSSYMSAGTWRHGA